jgi:hypothetical protein
MTTISLLMSWLLASGAAVQSPPATASLRTDGRTVSVVETQTSSNADAPMLERRFVADGRVFYRSRLQDGGARWEWSVDIGHPIQKGRVLIRQGSAEGIDANGATLWTGTTTRPICVPDVFAEVAVHYDDQLRQGVTLVCMTPVPKARKLAPLAVRRIADGADGRRRYSIGPGSLGMRLFVKSTTLETSADGRFLLAQRGQFEASYAQGRFRYIEGDAVYSTPHALTPLPNIFRASGTRP